MLKDTPLWAVVSVKDLAQAKKFYGEMLGLTMMSEEMPGGLLFSCGEGTGLVVYEKPTMSPSDNTVAGWNVKDLATEMTKLRAKGVTFEEYDIPEMKLKTENGVATFGEYKSAWLKDPDGNIFAINQM